MYRSDAFTKASHSIAGAVAGVGRKQCNADTIESDGTVRKSSRKRDKRDDKEREKDKERLLEREIEDEIEKEFERKYSRDFDNHESRFSIATIGSDVSVSEDDFSDEIEDSNDTDNGRNSIEHHAVTVHVDDRNSVKSEETNENSEGMVLQSDAKHDHGNGNPTDTLDSRILVRVPTDRHLGSPVRVQSDRHLGSPVQVQSRSPVRAHSDKSIESRLRSPIRSAHLSLHLRGIIAAVSEIARSKDISEKSGVQNGRGGDKIVGGAVLAINECYEKMRGATEDIEDENENEMGREGERGRGNVEVTNCKTCDKADCISALNKSNTWEEEILLAMNSCPKQNRQINSYF